MNLRMNVYTYYTTVSLIKTFQFIVLDTVQIIIQDDLQLAFSTAQYLGNNISRSNYIQGVQKGYTFVQK